MCGVLRGNFSIHRFGKVSDDLLQFECECEFIKNRQFPFRVFFIQKYGFSPTEANFVNSIVYIISAVASPLFGWVIDKTGRNVFWVLISVLGTIFAHSLLAFTFANPYIGMVTMGLAYSMLASSLWPLVALIIPEYQLGTAYGM